MRIALGTVVVAGTAAVVVFACSSFDSTAEPPADAAVDAASDVVADAATDGPPTADADASPARGCARYVDAAFCEDFEDGGLGPERWTEVEIDPTDAGVALLSSSNDSPISPPHAARIELTSSHGDCYYAHLYRRLSGTYKHVRVRTAVKETMTDTGFFAIGSKRSDGTATFTHIVFAPTGSINVLSQRGIVADGGIDDLGGQSHQLDVAFAGAWHDVVVDLLADGSNKSMKVTVDTNIVLTYPLPEDFELQDPNLAIGPFCTPAGGAGFFEFDDVAAWTE